jgi:thiol-disulfide isomerase/thioredoxin
MKPKNLVTAILLMLSTVTVTVAQNITAPQITDSILAQLKELDPNAPASNDIDYDFDKIAYYDVEGNLLTGAAKKEFKSDPEYTIAQMFADDKNVVRVVLYKRSSEAEKAHKESFQRSLQALNPNFFKGKPVKPFSVKDMDGNVHTNESLKGKVIVLNFWFVGCKPCEEEMPVLNALVDKYKNQDVVFLAISYDSKDKVKEFLKTTDFDYTIIPENTKMIMDYSIMAYPDNMIIDTKSVIQYKGNLNKERLFDFMSEYIDLCLAAQ